MNKIMKTKIYFSESFVIRAGENMRKRFSSRDANPVDISWVGKNSVNKSVLELRTAFKKAAEQIG